MVGDLSNITVAIIYLFILVLVDISLQSMQFGLKNINIKVYFTYSGSRPEIGMHNWGHDHPQQLVDKR